MPISVDSLTIEDFTNSRWREVVVEAKNRDCADYTFAFSIKADEAQAAGDEKRRDLFAMLSALTSMWIDTDDASDPLKPLWNSNSVNSHVTTNFASASDYLTSILPHVNDPELKARIADVIWLCKRDYKVGREASIAYMNAAEIDADRGGVDPISRLERAIDLAARANHHDLLADITKHIETGLTTFDGTEASDIPACLMKLLQKRKAGDPGQYAALAETFALAAESRGDWHSARAYWDIQANWYGIAQDDERAHSARLHSAETFVVEAEARIASGESQSHMIGAHFMEKAIHALRAVGGQQERIAELHRRLLDHQEHAVSEMGTVSFEEDATEIVTLAMSRVADKSLYDAIFALALIARSPSVETLKEQAQWQRVNSIASLIPMRHINAMGRTVARNDPPEDGESHDEANLRLEMYHCANQGRSINAQALIEPARLQILREHTVRFDDLMAIVQNNPFIPPGREKFFARGLQAGFRSDFATAIHLLIPQVENSIRYVLEQQGVITSGLDHEGIQDERDLNRTLRLPEFAGPLMATLGEDLVFDLRGLLIERHGANLRNDTAHGLLDYSSFYSYPCLYFWWLTLRLCCMPVITALRQQSEQVADTSDAPTEDHNNQDGGSGEGVQPE
ncbi:DUF4209 domain-containing protein [Capsulimonas corticalis]|uniref:DUF4209 domain-containing protein n=1 Tax=Capsulimonas corticalis TaxID=2219043 RepID=A0A402CW00_9BACT|nr:DUF4209 domain-containing protein [Capsulimonas corticalis]BDI33992.1 DUF4209 domain-containing protein [Capsulimonas corticalis]